MADPVTPLPPPQAPFPPKNPPPTPAAKDAPNAPAIEPWLKLHADDEPMVYLRAIAELAKYIAGEQWETIAASFIARARKEQGV